MKRIVLYGELRQRFGCEHRFEVQTAGEAFHALSCVVDGFREYMLDNANSRYRTIAGGKDIEPGETVIGGTIRFVPVVSGASGETFFGLAFPGEAVTRDLVRGKTPHQIWMSTYNQVGMGAGMALVGYAATYWAGWAGGTYWGPMLASAGIGIVNGALGDAIAAANRDTSQPIKKETNDSPTYAFTGPHLTVGQGNPVPVLLGGPLRIGGAIISAGRSTEYWVKNGLGGKGNDKTPTLPSGNGSTIPFVWAIPPVEVR